MPLPVAHSLAGASIFAGLDEDGGLGAWKRLLMAVFVANAPDLDMIPGLLVGEPNRYHHGISHSLGMAVIVSLLAAACALAGPRWPLRAPGGRRLRGPAAVAAMVGLIWASHVLLDALGQDLSEPVGVPALWPLSGRYVEIWPLFSYVDKLGGEGGVTAFVVSLMNLHNLRAILLEIATMLPVLVLVLWWRRARRGDRDGAGASGKEDSE